MLKSLPLCLILLLIGLASAPCFAASFCEKTLKVSDFRPRQIITESDVRQNLEKLRQRCGPNCERDGIFGPGSMMWEVSKVPYLGLFAATELYLQLAHPAAAQGVHDDSRLLKTPVERFQSTFDFIWRMTYGSFSEAEKLALTLNRIHSGVTGVLGDTAGAYTRGDPYVANDSEAILWVHATHWFSVLKTYEVFVRPLTATERDAYMADTKKYGMLMGLPEDRIPGTWDEFNTYFEHMLNSGELKYTIDARIVEQRVRELVRVSQKKNLFTAFVGKYSDIVAASTLPPQFAREFDLRGGLVSRAVHEAALIALRNAYQRLPEWFQILPIYRIAKARAEGRAPKARDELAHRVLVGK